VSSLKRQNILKSSAVERALLRIKREEFVWEDSSKDLAYLDEPLPLGDTDQTISAPHMVTIMLEDLKLAPGLRVLEIGTGTGYNACLIAVIVSEGARSSNALIVTTVERNPRLAEAARRNIERAGLTFAIEVVEGDGSLGYPARSEAEMYDRIVVTAGAPLIPKYLEKQLKPEGILLVPVGKLPYQILIRITKKSRGSASSGKRDDYKREELTPCMFVPLIGEDAFQF
jgi:protein-L-isoaspartate(D-aspartate) O-methyltransferase